MASATLPSAETPERGNSLGRIFGVLFSPKTTFESIARRPTWLLPVLLLCIVELGVVAVYGHRAGWRGLIEKQMSNSSQFQELPAARKERQIEIAAKVAPYVAYFEVIIGPFVAVLLFAGIFWLIFNMIVGAKFGFKTSLGIVSYGLMPGVLLSLLGILILFLKDPSTVDLQHLVASNVGAFLSDSSPKWLIAGLRAVDLFLFWEMILLAIGYSAAAPKKISFGKAFAWILSLWFLVVLIIVGLTAAFT
jgi:Yip1 domain